MKKIFAVILIVTLLSACGQDSNNNSEFENNEDVDIQNVELTTEIFTSDKENDEIDEIEIKNSIQTYLDSHTLLDETLDVFEDTLSDAIDEEEELNKDDVEKITETIKLIQANDENFSKYILTNTLPKEYQKETEKISHFITTYNELHVELGDVFIEQVEAADKGQFAAVDLISLMSKINTVKGKEQKKIETFLKEKNIKTKAFGMEY